MIGQLNSASVNILVGLIAAGVGAVATLLAKAINRKPEAAHIIAQAAAGLVGMQEAAVANLSQQVDRLQAEVLELQGELGKVAAQLANKIRENQHLNQQLADLRTHVSQLEAKTP